MIPLENFNRPQTLQLGEFYIYRERSIFGKHPGASVVIFSCYTACPAFVIIQNKSGKKIRCPRDDLFALNDSKFIPGAIPNYYSIRTIKDG